MAAHVIDNVVYLVDDRGRDSGGAVTCGCGWHAEATTHGGVAEAFAGHRRSHGLSASAKAGLTKTDGTVPAVWRLT